MLVVALATSRTNRTTNVKLTVLEKPVPVLISLALASPSVSFRQGESGSVGINISRFGAAQNGSVGLSVSGVPSGMMATLASNTSATSESLALSADLTGTHGDHTLTVTATFPGSQPAILTVPVQLLGAQNVTVKVVTATNAAAPGDTILVEGQSKTAGPDGVATFLIPVGRGDPYSAAVFGVNVFSGTIDTYFYQGLTRSDPVLKKLADYGTGGVSVIDLQWEVENASGTLFTAANSATILPMWSTATLGGVPISSTGSRQRFNSTRPPWATTAYTTLPAVSFEFPSSNNVVFSQSAMMIELQSSVDGTPVNVNTTSTQGHTPRTYLAAGQCDTPPLNALSDQTYTIGGTGSAGQVTCNGVYGVTLTGVTGATGIVTAPVPTGGFTFTERQLILVAGDPAAATPVRVASDCYTGVSPCLPPATLDANNNMVHTYLYPTTPGFRAFARHTMSKMNTSLTSFVRLGSGATLGAAPELPQVTVPASVAYGAPLQWSPGGFSGKMFRSVLFSSQRGIYCFTMGSSCTIPTWVRDLSPGTAMTAGATVSWQVSASDSNFTVDSFATTSAREAINTDDYTRDVSYRALISTTSLSFP